MKTREHISLIGMSNIGKSHWSRYLATNGGYEHVDCDALVEQKLAEELKKQGFHGLHDVAKWMGQPYDAQYPYTSQKYQVCERQVMLEVIESLKASPKHPMVVDTTGSVVYVGDDVMQELKNLTRVVYFEATPAHTEKMFKRYIAHPKPVIWGESFKPSTDETIQERLKKRNEHLLALRAERYGRYASGSKPVMTVEGTSPGEDVSVRQLLRECYPNLLAFRAKRYAAMADISVPFEKHNEPGITWDKLMANT